MENGRGDRFRYDEEGQLVEAWYNATDPANSGAGNQRYDQFNYDALGNRRGANYSQTKGWTQYTRKDNGLNQYSGPWPSFFTKYDEDVSGWGAPHAANGVLMKDGNILALYNALNQPMLINTQAMGSNWLFLGYDPLGRCVKRWVGPLPSDGTLIPPAESNPATYFYYEGWNLIQEGPSFANAAKNYVHGARVDEIVKQIRPTDWWERYFHYDARGHCTLQTDTAGAIIEQYEYDAFGQPYFYDSWGNNIGYSPWGNRFLFTGREYLSDLKLYDYRNRMYQPELGRFMQPDPKEFGAGDYNLYRYCHNDPVDKNDPTGLDPVVIDPESDMLSRQGAQQSMELSNANSRFFGLYSYEYAVSVVQDAQGKRLTGATTDHAETSVHPPSEPNAKTLVESHNHTFDLSPAGNFYTHTQLSEHDVNRAIVTGIPVVMRTPRGVWQRYRPSDALTEGARRQEGGRFEQLVNGQWKQIQGNDKLPIPHDVRNVH
jgi:RHS repeat-associated protein